MDQKKFLSNLKENGLRLTPLKVALFDLFSKKAAPLSVSEIQLLLKKKHLEPNKTSLYRELESLEEIGILSEVAVHQNIMSYELNEDNAHHHHFICENCKAIFDFHNDALEETIGKIFKNLRRKGLAPKEHHLNLYGLCQKCQ